MKMIKKKFDFKKMQAESFSIIHIFPSILSEDDYDSKDFDFFEYNLSKC